MATDLHELDPRSAWEPFTSTADRPWNRSLAAHLYRRAGFAANTAQLDDAARRPPAEVMDELFHPPGADAFESDVSSIGRTILAGRNPQIQPTRFTKPSTSQRSSA